MKTWPFDSCNQLLVLGFGYFEAVWSLSKSTLEWFRAAFQKDTLILGYTLGKWQKWRILVIQNGDRWSNEAWNPFILIDNRSGIVRWLTVGSSNIDVVCSRCCFGVIVILIYWLDTNAYRNIKGIFILELQGLVQVWLKFDKNSELYTI